MSTRRLHIKAEFDAALADFNARLTTFEAGINSKIDSQVTSYLDRNGIWNGKKVVPVDHLVGIREHDLWPTDWLKENIAAVPQLYFTSSYVGPLKDELYKTSINAQVFRGPCFNERSFDYVLSHAAPKSGLLYIKYTVGSWARLEKNAYPPNNETKWNDAVRFYENNKTKAFDEKSKYSVAPLEYFSDSNGLCVVSDLVWDNYYDEPTFLAWGMRFTQSGNTLASRVLSSWDVTRGHPKAYNGGYRGYGVVSEVHKLVNVDLFFVQKDQPINFSEIFYTSGRCKAGIYGAANSTALFVTDIEEVLIY